MREASKTVKVDGKFVMHRGGFLESPTIAYETWGELKGKGENAIVLFTGLSPSAHAASSPGNPSAGWWEDMIGPAKPVDTERYFVICINSLGSCFGSTGPASIDPTTGDRYRLNFPVLTVEDIAEAASNVLDHYGIDAVHTVMGASMGGMTALSFAQEEPGRCRRLASISSAARSLPFSIALRSVQREIIRTDPEWNNGNYDIDGNGPISGMRLARKLGMISYRSAIEWQDRFGRDHQFHFPREQFGMTYEVESYLEAAARRFIGAFDPCCYLYLSRAMDWFDASAYHDDLPSALQAVKLDSACVISVETDVLFPPRQQKEIADSLTRLGIDTRLELLPSPQGHDAFLVDRENFGRVIGGYLGEIRDKEGL